MTLHLITYPYQALQGANYSDLINPKGKFSDPTCRFLTATSDFGYSFSLLQLKDTRNTRKCHIVFANQKENSLPERGSSKHDEMLKSISAPSGNNQFQENSNVNIVIPVSHSEVNPKKDDFGYPVNRQNLLDRLKAVHLHVLASEQWNASRLKLCHRNYLVSATNLIHYMALKCLDIEQLKEELTFAGLLNLETINPYILASIDAGIQVLENKMSISLSSNKITNSMNLNVENVSDSLPSFQVLDHIKKGDFTISAMRRKVLAHENSLLGPRQGGRTTQIMVTIGKEVTENETLVSDLLSKGTTIFRINCAHGDPSVWSEIISRIKRSSMKLEKPCQILMDLAGPKLRTDHMKPGPSVMKISPKKDATGSVIFPAQVWLSHTGSGPPPAHLSPDVVLFVDSEQFLSCLEVGDVLRFYDTKGRKRSLKISKRFPVFAGVGFMAVCLKTSYVESGTKFYQKRKKGMNSVGRLVNVPALEPFVRLKTGDLLVISRDPCSIVKEESGGSTVGAPRVSCSSSYLFDSVKPGEPIAFDDGKIWGVIQGSSSSEIIVSITHASPKGSKLGSEKSINIPQSEIKFEGLTSKDLLDLDFVAENADMVGISFIRNVRDVVVLQQELEQRRLNKLGIVLKIETQSGFENLPLLLLQAMQSSNPLGVMIARGDLAVECGWENLADIQEDILSVCGAAHVPVIWATQVLESLVKSGLPSRAEITDVANGRRASCIMLNKGKYIVGAVSTLNSILQSSSKKMKSDLKPLLLSNQ